MIHLRVQRLGNSRHCHGSGLRKMILDDLDPKGMVAMRMGQIDRGQVFPTLLQPIYQLSVLVNGCKGINQNGILGACDQRGGIGDPLQRLRAWWDVTGKAGAL
jgi:hypothetical protein